MVRNQLIQFHVNDISEKSGIVREKFVIVVLFVITVIIKEIDGVQPKRQ